MKKEEMVLRTQAKVGFSLDVLFFLFIWLVRTIIIINTFLY